MCSRLVIVHMNPWSQLATGSLRSRVRGSLSSQVSALALRAPSSQALGRAGCRALSQGTTATCRPLHPRLFTPRALLFHR